MAKGKTRKKAVAILIGGIILLTILGLFGRSYREPTTQPVKRTTMTQLNATPISPKVKITKSSIKFFGEAKTKQYNQEDVFFGTIKYEDIIPISDDSLSSLSCSKSSTEFKANESATVAQYSKILSDKYQDSNPQKNVNTFRICSSSSGKTIAFYQLEGGCGGGCYGLPHVALIENNTITKDAEIPNEKYTLYYACFLRPLALSKTGDLYVSCTGYEESATPKPVSNAVYKLNLDSFNITKINSAANR